MGKLNQIKKAIEAGRNDGSIFAEGAKRYKERNALRKKFAKADDRFMKTRDYDDFYAAKDLGSRLEDAQLDIIDRNAKAIDAKGFDRLSPFHSFRDWDEAMEKLYAANPGYDEADLRQLHKNLNDKYITRYQMGHAPYGDFGHPHNGDNRMMFTDDKGLVRDPMRYYHSEQFHPWKSFTKEELRDLQNDIYQ